MKYLNALVIGIVSLTAAGTAFAGIPIPEPTPMPEPGTLALLAGGVATALWIRNRKK